MRVTIATDGCDLVLGRNPRRPELLGNFGDPDTANHLVPRDHTETDEVNGRRSTRLQPQQAVARRTTSATANAQQLA